MWVMSNYYNMPENTTMLTVIGASFNAENARSFNVSILNPSNSVSDATITAIQLIGERSNEIYKVTDTTPPLPYLLRIGEEVTFQCNYNWGELAGEKVRIEPIAGNASTKSKPYLTPSVKWSITPRFDPSKTVNNFTLTIRNSENSEVNLTISKIKIFELQIENVTPALPYVLHPKEEKNFICHENWEKWMNQNVTVTVETMEGYELTYTTSKLPMAILFMDNVNFDYNNTGYFNVTVKSSEDSTTTATLNGINLKLQDGSWITPKTVPPLNVTPILLTPNSSLTIKCLWNWSSHRNENITVEAYTKEGFTVPPKTVKTPNTIIWNVTDVKFNLDDLQHFNLTVKNMPCSLSNITVTSITFNGVNVDFTSQTISAGEEKVFTCTYNWTLNRGENVMIKVYTEEKLNRTYSLKLPDVKLEVIHVYFNINSFNFTIRNSDNSLKNVTLTRIMVTQGDNKIYESNGIGQTVRIGENITLTFSWNWNIFENEEAVLTLYTEEGYKTQVSIIIGQSHP